VLAELADELRCCQRPWWVIGSAAMAVHGAPVTVCDVDLLLDSEDARILLARRGLPAEAGTPNAFFSSEVFASWDAQPYRVELFAGFRVHTPQGWLRLRPKTREACLLEGTPIYVPAVAELIAWGRLFGREKDKQREPLLLALLA
jgi:hypothetical protein